MIKTITTFLLFSFVGFSQMNFCSKNKVPRNENSSNTTVNIKKPTDSPSNRSVENRETANEKAAEKFISISELNNRKPGKGIFETQGFVVNITDCPACPPDANCKPCMAENVVISEENKVLETYDLTDSDLIIFTKKSEDFKKGTEYKYKIKITDKKTTSANLNDVELISFEVINN